MATSETDFTPPYTRSWFDRLLDWVEGLPGPIWVPHLGWFAVCFFAGNYFEAPNYPNIPGWLFTSISAILFSSFHWLRIVSAKSVERVRPALDPADPEAQSLAYRLTYAPPRTAYLFLAIEAIYLPLYALSEAEPFGYRDLPGYIFWPGLLIWFIGESAGWILVYQTGRRLVLISRARQNLGRVELFRQQPLHALSAVTMRSSIALLFLFGYVPLLSLGSEAFTDPYYLGSLVTGAAFALVVAIAPLRGTHVLIVEEKRRRELANGERIERTLASLEAAIDSQGAQPIEADQKALTALLAEREMISKAPTWPWTPGTIRTLATSVVLPVVLVIVGRLANRWIG